MCLNTLTQSDTRAIGALIHKNKSVDLSYNTFTTLNNPFVLQCGYLKISPKLKLFKINLREISCV